MHQVVDAGFGNAEFWDPCEVKEVDGKYWLKTPMKKAVIIGQQNFMRILKKRFPHGGRVVITGALTPEALIMIGYTLGILRWPEGQVAFMNPNRGVTDIPYPPADTESAPD